MSRPTIPSLPQAMEGGRFLDCLGAGLELNQSQDCVTARPGHMLCEYGSALGEQVVDTCHTSRQVWCFSVNTNLNAGVAVGVADASVELTSLSGPSTCGWHIGKGVPVQTKDGRKLVTSGMTTGKMDPRASRKAAGKAPIRVLVIVDMETRRLAISVDGAMPLDLGVTIPPSVRPWVFLYGPMCGSVTLSEVHLADIALIEAVPKRAPEPRSVKVATGNGFLSSFNVDVLSVRASARVSPLVPLA